MQSLIVIDLHTVVRCYVGYFIHISVSIKMKSKLKTIHAEKSTRELARLVCHM